MPWRAIQLKVSEWVGLEHQALAGAPAAGVAVAVLLEGYATIS